MARTRTNIVIENDHVETIKTRYGLHTKTEAVDLALRHFAGVPMRLDEALALRGSDPDFAPPLDQHDPSAL